MLDSEYRVILLTTFKQLQRYWEYFQQALAKLNDLSPANDKVPEETFLRAALDSMRSGIVPIITRKGEGKVLALGIAMDISNAYHPPSLGIYAVHSWGDASVVKFLLAWTEQWAKKQGFKELSAWSPRINGSAFYLFEKKWGFRRRSIHFTKAI